MAIPWAISPVVVKKIFKLFHQDVGFGIRLQDFTTV